MLKYLPAIAAFLLLLSSTDAMALEGLEKSNEKPLKRMGLRTLRSYL